MRINSPGSFVDLHDFILEAMEQDGRFTDDDAEEPSEDFLLKCLDDEDPIVRVEADLALKQRRWKPWSI